MERGIKMFKHFMTEIVRVVDGDTVYIECEIGNQAVRLEHIDAPEIGWPLWRESKEYIEKHWMNEGVWCTVTGVDRYGRWIATFENDNCSQLHWELLKKGLAFHYRKYSNDQASFVMEKKARDEGAGLWAIPNSYTEWKSMLVEKEIAEKKKSDDDAQIPYLVIILDDTSDSNVDADFIPLEMVPVKNFRKITREPDFTFDSHSYIGYVEDEGTLSGDTIID
jgi:endonuclease YncB( thermonuclease family)